MRTITKLTFFSILVFSLFTEVKAQLKVGDNPSTLNPSAALEVESTNKGMLLPRVALTGTANAAPLAAHVAGMVVYNTAAAGDVKPGFYYNDGNKWAKIDESSATTNASNQVVAGNPISAQCLGGFPSSTAKASSSPATYSYGGITFKRIAIHTFTQTGHSYAVYVNQSPTGGVSWFACKDAAANLGGYLATFTNYDEWVSFNAVIDPIASLDNVWMWFGMARYGYGQGWFQDKIDWITCEESDRYTSQGSTSRITLYHNFAASMPDNFQSNEGFIHTWGKNRIGVSTPFGAGTSHAWNDIDAGGSNVVRGFIVEFQQ